jgi:putative transposase
LDTAKRTFTYDEILQVVREAESGEAAVAICRQNGITDRRFSEWKQKYLENLPELRQLREENAKLRRMVASLEVDRQILKDIFAKRIKVS